MALFLRPQALFQDAGKNHRQLLFGGASTSCLLKSGQTSIGELSTGAVATDTGSTLIWGRRRGVFSDLRVNLWNIYLLSVISPLHCQASTCAVWTCEGSSEGGAHALPPSGQSGDLQPGRGPSFMLRMLCQGPAVALVFSVVSTRGRGCPVVRWRQT